MSTIAATALVSGNDPDPRLAEEAVVRALQTAGLDRAAGILLFLTPEFSRHAPAALTAAARRAQCLEIAGGIASGVFTERGWALDRPSAAALALGDALSFGAGPATGACMHYAGRPPPSGWPGAGTHFGGAFAGPLAGGEETVVWQHGRVTDDRLCRVQWREARVDVGISRGWLPLGEAQRVDAVHGYDIERLDGLPARRRLAQILPPALRDDPARHLHHIAALPLPPDSRGEPDATSGGAPLALIALGAGDTLTVSERVQPGQRLRWAVRQPDATAADMRRMLAGLAAQAEGVPPPGCALLFSCIGRGPYYYGGDDRDLQAFRERFPGLPALGVYGTGQFAPGSGPCQNAVVAALIRPAAQVG